MSLLHSSLYITEWAETDVVERFLKPIGMEFLAKAFIENKINGAVLMALTEDHMKEMGCAVLGKLCHYKTNSYRYYSLSEKFSNIYIYGFFRILSLLCSLL